MNTENMSIGGAIAFIAACASSGVALGLWFAGIVLAQGFWSTCFALFHLYAWYLVVERIIQILGVMP